MNNNLPVRDDKGDKNRLSNNGVSNKIYAVTVHYYRFR